MKIPGRQGGPTLHSGNERKKGTGDQRVNNKEESYEYQLHGKTGKIYCRTIESGDLKNAREVVRDALRLHEVYRHRIIEELHVEIARGWEGQASARKPSDIVRDKLSSLEKQAL